MIGISIIAVLTAVAIPVFRTYRADSQRNVCRANLKLLDSASRALILRDNLPNDAEISERMLVPGTGEGADRSRYFIMTMPVCPNGGRYEYDRTMQTWSCQDGNH